MSTTLQLIVVHTRSMLHSYKNESILEHSRKWIKGKSSIKKSYYYLNTIIKRGSLLESKYKIETGNFILGFKYVNICSRHFGDSPYLNITCMDKKIWRILKDQKTKEFLVFSRSMKQVSNGLNEFQISGISRLWLLRCNFRSNHQSRSVKKAVFTKLEIFTWKYLCWSLKAVDYFFKKVRQDPK